MPAVDARIGRRFVSFLAQCSQLDSFLTSRTGPPRRSEGLLSTRSEQWTSSSGNSSSAGSPLGDSSEISAGRDLSLTDPAPHAGQQLRLQLRLRLLTRSLPIEQPLHLRPGTVEAVISQGQLFLESKGLVDHEHGIAGIDLFDRASQLDHAVAEIRDQVAEVLVEGEEVQVRG